MEPERGAAWRPILGGELGARAEAAVTAIAEAVAEPGAVPRASLGGGLPGLALLHGYLERARPGQGHGERAAACLEAAIDEVASAQLDASLYGGFTGVAWAIDHLGDPGDPDDANEEIDAALADLLAESPWRDDYDLIGGLAGFAVYALERPGRPSRRVCLERILDRLEEAAERRAGRACWKTAPELLIERTRQEYPAGYYNLGVAHGVPGVVVVLAAMDAAGIGGGRARPLLDEAAAWLRERRLPDGAGSRFPYFETPGAEPRPARLAWCYGDPGIAAALLAAGRAAGDEALAGEALAVAREAAARSTDRSDVIDAGLCHGAAGLGHLFNRIHQTTGDQACAGAARRWFARALEMRRPGEGVAGILAWTKSDPTQGTWQASPGFLVGAAGVALALLAATSAVEPAWDRALLASCAPVTRPAT